jgi:DNA topoisomerase IB
MARKGGWQRVGSRGRFRYYDARGNHIRDEAKLARIESRVIPPAWKDVWISPRPNAKLQATGLDKAGRRQYLYHPAFRAQQEQEKYDRLIRFAERLPDLRATMAEHMDRDALDRERVCAVAIRLINRAWFRVGGDRCKGVSDVWHHDAHEAPCRRPRQPDRVPFSRQAQGPCPHDARRQRARET